MNPQLIIFLAFFIFAFLSIIAAVVLIIRNVRIKKFILTHQEKGLVLKKYVKAESSKTKIEYDSDNHYLMDVRLNNGLIKTFAITDQQYREIKSGETGQLVYIKKKLLYYESNHKISASFTNDLSERYPFYHQVKKGLTCQFSCDIPSQNYLVYSDEPLILDFSEVKTVIYEMENDVESFILLTKAKEQQLEIVCLNIKNEFEIISKDADIENESIVSGALEVLEIIEKWMND